MNGPPKLKDENTIINLKQGLYEATALKPLFEDLNYDLMTYSFENLPSWLKFNPVTYSLTSLPTQSGLYTVTMIAQDFPGSYATRDLTIKVLETEQPKQIE